MKWKKLLVILLTFALAACQRIVPSSPVASTPTVQPEVTNTATSSTHPEVFIDHMRVKDLFEGAVLVGKYYALQFSSSPEEACSLLCCRLAEHLDVEQYVRNARWISRFELDSLTPLSLVPGSPLRLNNTDIENGNLVFLSQARAWQTQDSLLAIENGKPVFNFIILSKTSDGWRIAEINTAYPTENLVDPTSTRATATAQTSSPIENLEYEDMASQPDVYLGLARVSGFLTQADLLLQGKMREPQPQDREVEDELRAFLDQLGQPQRVFVDQILPLEFTEIGSSITSTDVLERHVVIEAKLRLDDNPSVWYFTLGHSEDGLSIIGIDNHYP